MKIKFVELQNFRKFKSVRVDLSEEKTIFVGANNSGKTTAIVALRRFLIEQKTFDVNDFTVTNWRQINAIGKKWEEDPNSNHEIAEWEAILPALDVWLDVKPSEIQYVQHLLPTLEWNGEPIGVRLRLEPTKLEDLKAEYVALRQQAEKVIKAANKSKDAVPLWPATIKDYLERNFNSKFRIRSYILDPNKVQVVKSGNATPQSIDSNVEGSEENPFSGLIRIDEVNAQRGFSDAGNNGDTAGDETESIQRRGEKRKLGDQVRSYFDTHLNPNDMPEGDDLEALEALYRAQGAFNEKLQTSLALPLGEIQSLGYPGISDPKVKISTKIKLTDGLNHASAFQYEIDSEAHLPEQYNGLGYQNLISMVFRLMSFRDAWMQLGKLEKKMATKPDTANIPPLHLVLIEEPEAHLHVQVQQVFIRRAYDILRNHPKLRESSTHTTQMIVSTHSSHIAHECEFSCLRYFQRRLSKTKGQAPTSTIINLSEVFGKDNETERFVARYLRAAHCDLFFADAAILIEGAAERMLLPHFIKKNHLQLNHRYLTILEVGGSHAHRFKSLIEHLGLSTLIITDIDLRDEQTTSNPTLKDWLPKKAKKDELLQANITDKIYTDQDANFSVRVAYQVPVEITLDAKVGAVKITPNTFEDALLYTNIPIFRTLEGGGLIKKFRTALEEKKTPEKLRESVLAALGTANKAEFALELLFYKDPQDFAVPQYISEGLKWLEELIARPEDKTPQNDNPKSSKVEAA